MDRKNLQHLNFLDSETVKKNKSKKIKHQNFVAGIAPYLRGPYSTMYVLSLIHI